MGAQIYYGKRVAGAVVTSTTAQAGYPASNILSTSIKRPHKATNQLAHDVVINYGEAAALHSIAVHDVNFAQCSVYKSADGVNFVLVGVMQCYADEEGRLRGRITINDANVWSVKISIAAGASTDGLPWNIGAAYPWTSSTALSTLIFPLNEQVVEPALSTDLATGPAEASIGVRYSRIETNWRRKYTSSLQLLLANAKRGTVWLDAGTSDYPHQQWPVYLALKDQRREGFEQFRYSKPQLTLTERV